MKAAVKSFAASSSSSSLASVRAHMWFLHGLLTTFSAALFLLLLSLALTTTTSTCQAAFTRTMILFVHPTTLRPCARRSSKTSSYGSSFTTTAVATIAHMSSSTAGDDNDEDHQQQQQASSSSSSSPQEQDRLVLSKEAIQQQMAQLRSKYPTTEADYLAAARARNAARVASTERQATDDDWQSMATEKEQKYGKQDDWEASQKDAGNADESQILLPLEMTKEGSLDEDDEEPKLMLF